MQMSQLFAESKKLDPHPKQVSLAVPLSAFMQLACMLWLDGFVPSKIRPRWLPLPEMCGRCTSDMRLTSMSLVVPRRLPGRNAHT